MNKPTLIFGPISLFSPGELADIVGRSYVELVEKWPDPWGREREKWEDFDRQAFAHPESMGKCVFVSCHEGKPVGLASYDPRPGPSYAIVGQNCVLPEYRCQGFGRLQIFEILRRFRTRKIRLARVTTSEHPFFLPAVRLYKDLGFQEIRRLVGGPDPSFHLIELEKKLLT